MGKIYVLDPGKNKQVFAGDLEGDTFTKKVKAEHYMRKYGGYGIQSNLIEEFLNSEVQKIRLILATGTIYESVPYDWWTKGRLDNVGNGEQIFLSTEDMVKIEVTP